MKEQNNFWRKELSNTLSDLEAERADFRPERADFRPVRAWGGRTHGRTDGRTNESPPVFYRTSSPSGPLPKKAFQAIGQEQ